MLNLRRKILKKKIIPLLVFLFTLLLFSCSKEENAIKEVIKQYQTALNSNNSEKAIELFEPSSAYGLQLTFAMLDVYREKGIETSYTIDIIDIKINGNIAEARLKSSVSYSGEDKQTIAALQMFTPTVVDTIMTFRKTNNNWKIIAEKSLD